MMRTEHAIPTLEQTRVEVNRLRQIKKRKTFFFNIVHVLIVAVAIGILVATMVLPIFRIYGTSMAPTMMQGDMIVGVKTEKFKTGDLIAFYYNNEVFIKRVIAQGGDWVDIDEDGTVYVNNESIDEPYLSKKSLGNCNIDLPYQVPKDTLFVMGDHRDVSVDSRNTALGCVSRKQIAGKLFFRIWPLKELGSID